MPRKDMTFNADHIVKMSIKLIEHARSDTGYDLVLRLWGVRIKLSSVDMTI
jgi:hypothetical protein